MSTFLGIALLVLGATSTGAAFGGKTWKEGPEPFLERVTTRGWLSVSCLVLALLLGIWKQIDDTKEKNLAKNLAATDKAAAEQQHKQELKSADEAQKQLERQLTDAELQLERVKALNEAQVGHLEDLRENLRGTRQELSEQSAAGLANVLAQTDQTISDITLVLPFTAHAHNATATRAALLPAFNLQGCSDLTPVQVQLLDNDEEDAKYFSVMYFAGDKLPAHTWFKGHILKADKLEISDSDFYSGGREGDIQAIKDLTGQNSASGDAYVLEMRPGDLAMSAAQVYGALTKPGAVPLTIRASWGPSFANTQAIIDFKAKYPSLMTWWVAPTIGYTNGESYFDQDGDYPYPSSCGAQFLDYFRTAFDKALLFITLNQKHKEIVVFRLKATAPKYQKYNGVDKGWVLEFVIDSAPMIRVGGAEKFNVTDTWPSPKATASH
jgi:hypothetical protein